MRYRCKKCKLEAEIDMEKKQRQVIIPLKAGAITTSFPSHDDCELGKSLSKIDLEKFEKVVRTR